MEYPGDLIMRPGRRVCRVPGWHKENLNPVLVSGTPTGSVPDTWCCGTLVGTEGEIALVETFELKDPPVWSYPAGKLKVNHSQEKMTDEQYLWALLTIQERIRGGLRLSAYDCTATGNKSTYCSWGFHDDDDTIPDIPKMWPIEMPERQRNHQLCPLATLPQPTRGWRGCFYRCLAFQRRKELTRRKAIELYTSAIIQARISNATD